MSYSKSLYDILSDALSPTLRSLQDINIDLMGTKVSVLRITTTSLDDGLMGDTEETLSSSLLNNVVIRYPFSEITLIGNLQSEDYVAEAVDFEGLLPIEMYIKWEGAFADDPVELKRGDIIVDCIFDDTGDKIPIVLEVTDIIAGFFGKNIVKKKYILSLVRGEQESAIQTEIDNYINSL